ncbi:MFS transporter [Kineococcus sp. NUM-3379]
MLEGFGRLLRRRDLRRLLLVRLLGQGGDGVFQAGLASLLIFSPERQAGPAAVAAGFAVLLLPFALVGPWAGIALDRWRRRQVLVAANSARAVVVALTALVLAAGAPDVVVVVLALAALSVNRALLAGLSASLPHVVRREDLALANSVVPTAGTVAAGGGALAAVALRSALPPGAASDAVLLGVAAGVYLVAGLAALRIGVSLLGPVHPPGGHVPGSAPAGAASRLAVLGRDLLGGAQHAVRRRAPAWALGVVAVHRFAFGVTTVAFVVLCRRTLTDPQDPAAGLALLTALLTAAGAGAALAAVCAPWGTRQGSLRTWICGCLAVAGAAQAVAGWRTDVAALVVCAVVLGGAGQGAKIGVDTVVQRTVDDAFRGRVFTLYDLVFNGAFVVAAGVAAVLLPPDGRFGSLAVCLGAAYWGTALLYRRVGLPPRAVVVPA